MSKRARAGGAASASFIKVEGLVQGVGFRRFVQQQARTRKLVGFVENRKDGSVTILVQGKDADIRGFVEIVRTAPSPVQVEAVNVRAARTRPSLRYFQIKSGPLATEIQEGFGGMETQFRDYREEFRDYREEFRDYREEFRDYREEFRDYREEFRGFAVKTNGNFEVLETKYGEISEKLTQILHELQTENRDSINSLNRSVDALLKAVEKLR